MKTVNIQVTWEDIGQGIAKSCGECPVALAVSRALDSPVHVWPDYIVLERGVSVGLPKFVKDFIRLFDSGVSVEPLTFTLQIPE